MHAAAAGVAAMLLALAGCSRPAPEARQANVAAPPGGGDAPYNSDLPMSEFMAHVMQYAGDGIWKRQGYVIDGDGEHSLFPGNDQEWEDAESASLALAELTNVLLLPGRRVAEPEWDRTVEGVRKVALAAAAAAGKKDADAFFKAGGELDGACDACHARYDPTFSQKPD